MADDFTPDASGDDFTPDAGFKPDEQQPLSWSQVPGQALSNLGSSAVTNVKAMAQPFMHPIETAENLGKVVAGGAQKLGVAPGTSFEPYADSLIDFYKNRYGSIEGLKHTLANDPVGAAADLSMFLMGPEAAAARIPGVGADVSKAIGTVGRAVNPVNAVTSAVPAISRGVGLTGSADVAAANAALADAGVLRTPGQRVGGMFKTAEDAISSVPILGSFVKQGRAASIESFDQAVGNQALAPVGLTTKAKAGHELMSDVHDKLDNAYNQMLPQMTFTADKDFINDLQKIRADIKATSTGERADQFDRIIQSRLPAMAENATYTGREFKDMESQLKKIANDYRPSTDGDTRRLTEALDNTVDAMKAGLGRSNPQQADQLAKLNYAWAMYGQMRSAATRRATSAGVFTPNDLLAAAKSSDRSRGKGAFAQGDALMQSFAEAGQKVLPSELPTSGTTERGMHAAALFGGAHLLAQPHLLAAGAAAAAPYTKLGMRATDIASRVPKATIARTALPMGRLGEIAGDEYGRAKGGRVDGLATKTQANYRGGNGRWACGWCTMFIKPSACSAVRGHISPKALCDYYEPEKGHERLVDNKYDVVTGANSSKNPNGPIFVDRHIPEWSPKLRTKTGKRVRLWTYLSIHEDEEQRLMEIEPHGYSYDTAHKKAEAREREALEKDGGNWKQYSDEIDGFLKQVEHEKVAKKPPMPLHVKPEQALKGDGHHSGKHKGK